MRHFCLPTLITLLTLCLAVPVGVAQAADSQPAAPAPVQAQPAADTPAAGEGAEQVALVNGVVIEQEDFKTEYGQAVRQMAQQGQPIQEDMVAQVREQVLDRMIEEELLYQASQEKGIAVGDEAVTVEIGNIKQRFESEEEFQEALKTFEMSEDYLKAKIQRGLAIKDLIENNVLKDLVVGDEESRAFYDQHPEMFKNPEQVKASHILIKVPEGADDAAKAAARAKLVQIQEDLKKGADFAEAARQHSEGPSNERGGELGVFQRGQMVKPFEDAAFALKAGEISDIVETPFGYHIILVAEHQEERVVPYEEAKGRLAEHLKRQKAGQEVDTYIQGLKDKAEVKKFI
jgi:peptidyl-prolyl cis-trans isomerase C